MIKKLAVGLTFVALVAVVVAQKLENTSLKAENSNISASMELMKADVGKVRAENAELKQRLDKVENRIAVLEMVASWYGPGFHGRTAADGSTYNQYAFTCAHKTLPFGTILVIEGTNGRRVPVVVTDRGPFVKGRDIDLSYATAERIGMIRRGVAPVKVYRMEI